MAYHLLSLLYLFVQFGDVSGHCYSHYNTYYLYYTYYCYTYVSAGTIAGSVIGTLIGIGVLIALLVFFCCIRPRRMAQAGTIVTHGNSPGVTVVSNTSGQQIQGAVNPVMYPQPSAGYPAQPYGAPPPQQGSQYLQPYKQ